MDRKTLPALDKTATATPEQEQPVATQLLLPIRPTSPPPARDGYRAIEVDFPVAEISRLARVESYRKNVYRPAYYIHKWWARRAGTIFRAILLGTLLPAGTPILDFFYRTNDFGEALVLDPFMGGGTTIGEASRLGARVIGVDVNPVAWFLVKKIIEPVSLDVLDRAFRRLEVTAGREIRRLYETTCPRCGGPAQAVYVYWVSVIPCEACGKPVPLRKSMILARHASKPHTGLVTCPACGHPYISSSTDREQACPICGTTFNAGQGFSRGATYTCPHCGATGQIVHALRERGTPPEREMLAIYYDCPRCGRGYKRPDEADRRHFEHIRRQFQMRQSHLLFPREPIPPGRNTDQMRNYNYRFWHQMFNERQLLALSSLLKAILTLEDRNAMETLLLLFSGTLEFNNMFCSPKGLGTGAVRPLFAHHAFIPAKEPLEANVWGVGRSSGGFAGLYAGRLRAGKTYALHPVERRLVRGKVVKVPIAGERISHPLAASFAELRSSGDRRVWLLNRSATDLSGIPDRSVDAIVTDPPYLDNVMYAELADFFYVWLRLGLRDHYRQFAPASAARPGEAVRNPRRGQDSDAYRETLTAVFGECHRVLKDDGLLVFTFHHGTAEAWDLLARSLVDSGFVIRRIWPVHAEMDVGVPILGKHSVTLDAILVCRKREDAPLLEEDAMSPEEYVDHLIGRVAGATEISEADRRNLTQAVVAMLYTQGKSEKLPSQMEEV